MAKSSLTLTGAKASKLELDFFKLAFSVAALRAKGEQATGYLQVLSVSARDRATWWCAKYSTSDVVVVLYSEPTEEERVALVAEKSRNAQGLLSTSNAERAEEELSLGSLGEKLGESALAREIGRRHPTVTRINDKNHYPQRINWDFYGIVEND